MFSLNPFFQISEVIFRSFILKSKTAMSCIFIYAFKIKSMHKVIFFYFAFQWNISDYFFQRGEIIEKELNKEEAAQQKQAEEKGVVLNRPFHPAPPFDCLWLCLYAKLGELCVDPRPAVRKSAGQTLFSTIGAHGTLLQHSTWHTVIWKVL